MTKLGILERMLSVPVLSSKSNIRLPVSSQAPSIANSVVVRCTVVMENRIAEHFNLSAATLLKL